MAILDISLKKIVLYLSQQGLSASQVASELRESYGITISRQSISKFLKLAALYHEEKVPEEQQTNALWRQRCNQMTKQTQLKELLDKSRFNVSLSTLKRCRRDIGWTFHGSIVR